MEPLEGGAGTKRDRSGGPLPRSPGPWPAFPSPYRYLPNSPGQPVSRVGTRSLPKPRGPPHPPVARRRRHRRVDLPSLETGLVVPRPRQEVLSQESVAPTPRILGLVAHVHPWRSPAPDPTTPSPQPHLTPLGLTRDGASFPSPLFPALITQVTGRVRVLGLPPTSDQGWEDPVRFGYGPGPGPPTPHKLTMTSKDTLGPSL